MAKSKLTYDRPQDEPAKLVIEATKAMEQKLLEAFNIEVEMMQATREPLSDGRTKITMIIHDQQKIDYICEFMLKWISGSATQNLN